MVHGLNPVENILRLILSGKYNEQFHIALGIPALAFYHGNTATDFRVYRVGYLLVFFRYYYKLHRLAGTVDNIITHETGHQGESHTVYNCLNTVEQDIGRANDTYIYELHGTSETHTEILVKQRYDNIRATGRTVMREHQAKAGTAHGTADKHMHEFILTRRYYGVGRKKGCKTPIITDIIVTPIMVRTVN